MAKQIDSLPDFIGIRTGSLAGDEPTTFDTYIKVGKRYILYCRNGDVFDGQRLTRLRHKNIAALYIQKEDYDAYTFYLQQNIAKAYSFEKATPVDVRSQVVIGYNTELVQKLFMAVEDADVYTEAQFSSNKFVEFICNDPNAFKAVMDIPNDDGNVAQHGVRVAALSVALANQLGLGGPNRPISHMVLGCFLHDLEHVRTNFDCVRPIAFLTPIELIDYKKHPMSGAQKVQRLSHIDAFVRQVILQHEEHADGSGFPKGLTEKEMDPLIMVVAVANAFDRLVSFEKQIPKDALKNLLIEKMGAYPLPYLQAMQKLLKERGVVAA